MTVKKAKERRHRIYRRYMEIRKEDWFLLKPSIERAAERMNITKVDLAKQIALVKKYGEEYEILKKVS